MNLQPPKYALRFLRWFCRDDHLEEIEANLLEMYEKQQVHSPRQAKLQFVIHVLFHLHPIFIRPINTFYSKNFATMFRHNLLLSYRNSLRHKGTFFINLIGLSSGIASALLIFLWVKDELHVDKFHTNDDQIYQVMLNAESSSGISTLEWTPGPLAQSLVNEISEVKYATSVIPPATYTISGVLSVDNSRIKAEAKYAGNTYFSIFSYSLIEGDKNEVLKDLNNIVISERMAMKLFNTTSNIVGNTIVWEQGDLTGNYLISGIFKEIPANASVHFDVVLNYELYKRKHPELVQWSFNSPSTYVMLEEQAQRIEFADKITDLIKRKDPTSQFTLIPRKYSDQHLYGNFENGKVSGGKIIYVRIFAIIAVFILLIACINFMNLATARASRRFKELGIKKAIGTKRATLILQYLSEAMLITFFSLFVALLLVILLLPQFNQITGKQLTLVLDPIIIATLVGITSLTGLVAGSYPAFYLSGFNPIKILRGEVITSPTSLWVRKGFVVFQFTISIILIVSVLVIYKQLQYVQEKNLGFQKDNVLIFEIDKLEDQPLNIFLNEIQNLPGVINSSTMKGNLTSGDHNHTPGLTWEGLIPGEEVNFTDIVIGLDFFETLGITMVEGRTFSRDFGSESSKIIFNQTAIERMGLDNPIGKTVNLWGENKQIIGVVSDFHYESLYTDIKPCFFRLTSEATNVLVKIRAGKEKETLAQLQDFYQDHKGIPLEYQFLDESYHRLYASEQLVSVLSRYFASLAIIISCLGLFGLASFTAELRLKEIGIRKILGISNLGVVRLLSRDFTNIVLVAIVIALPISYFIAQRWLEGFFFSIDLVWWYFASAGLLILLIAWLTVGLQTLKAARINPVDTLRNE
ncbi:MAG: ABC transporter permease [Bacteroidota bacterium]